MPRGSRWRSRETRNYALDWLIILTNQYPFAIGLVGNGKLIILSFYLQYDDDKKRDYLTGITYQDDKYTIILEELHLNK